MSSRWFPRDGREGRPLQGYPGEGRPAPGRFIHMTAAAALVVLAGFWAAQDSRVAAGTAQGQAGAKADAPVPAEISAFVAGIGERMTPCHERIARLSRIVLEAIRGAEPGGSDLDSQTSKVQAAEARLSSAKMAREFAELQLKEYLEAAVPQEQARLERELGEAKDDLNRAMKQRVKAIERCAKIKELSKGSASDLELEDRFEDGRVASELEQERAQFAIDLAKSKLFVLKTFKKHQRTMELKAEIERASSNELAAKAGLSLAEAQLKRSRKAGGELSESKKKLLGLLDQALAVDEGIRGKLVELRKNGKTDAGLQKEITELTNQLEAAVDRAEAEDARARFDAVKNAVGRAAAPGPRS